MRGISGYAKFCVGLVVHKVMDRRIEGRGLQGDVHPMPHTDLLGLGKGGQQVQASRSVQCAISTAQRDPAKAKGAALRTAAEAACLLALFKVHKWQVWLCKNSLPSACAARWHK